MLLHRLTTASWRSMRKVSRHLSSARTIPSPVPVLPSCPAPTCPCAETPAMPEGLEIDHTGPLAGVMAAYAQQVLICTGQSDWKSKIEEENGGDNLAADLKELLGRGGIYSDPYHNVLITNSSFPPSTPKRAEVQTASAYLLPSFKYVPFLPRVSFDSVQALVKGYLLPKELNPVHNSLSPIHKDRLLRSIEYQSLLYGVQDVEDILVLVCGHGGRDGRCGVFGPLLQDEFSKALPREGIQILQGPVPITEQSDGVKAPSDGGIPHGAAARIGLISHIGGHKFAGNVIIYIPNNAKTLNGNVHSLAGCGIWYGRVEPRHIEGIVSQTIIGGSVIQDIFRGGINPYGEILRL